MPLSTLPISLASHLPLPLVRQIAGRVLRRVVATHPKLFDRLGPYKSRLFVFEPVELSYCFGIRPASERVEVRRRGRFLRSDVKITGPLIVLLALAEGHFDGDAEFFSRRIRVEGDMEAALALRNALDDAGLDLPIALAPRHGPGRRVALRLLQKARDRLLAEAH